MGFILGFYRGYVGIMDKHMEITIWGGGFWEKGFQVEGLGFGAESSGFRV